jgi:hypothetical protein
MQAGDRGDDMDAGKMADIHTLEAGQTAVRTVDMDYTVGVDIYTVVDRSTGPARGTHGHDSTLLSGPSVMSQPAPQNS